MVDILSFYILSLGLILSTLFAVFVPTMDLALVFVLILFLLTGILYLSLGAIVVFVFQIVIFGIFIYSLLRIVIKQVGQKENYKNIVFSVVNKPRTIVSIILLSVGFILAGMLIYYFTNLQSNIKIFYSVENSFLPKIVSSFIIIKSVFTNYFLAYNLILLILLVSLIGVGILIVSRKVSDNNE